MLATCASSLARASARATQRQPTTSFQFARRTVTSKLGDKHASHAWTKSCYNGIDYTISDESTVFEAVEKIAAFDVGCLVTKDAQGKLSGVISERDYISKIALLGRKSKETLVKEISTKAANLITASPNDSVDDCMQKMLQKDIRHLPLVDENGDVVGIISIKDLIKECLDEKEQTIQMVASFAAGEGGHFVV